MIITDFSAICNLGDNICEIFQNATNGKLRNFSINSPLPEIKNEKYNIRCNHILLHCVNQIKNSINDLIQKYGKNRIGIVIATANTGIDEFLDTNNPEHSKISNPAEFLEDYLGCNNFYASVSTACSSGIKAFSTAEKLLENGVCDAVIAGGCDGMSRLPLAGFASLEVLIKERSNPMSKNRHGMNIGEGGAIFLLEKDGQGVKILSTGETSDAYHASTPNPTGTEAANAIKIALKKANLKPEDIDYINLHGTGTLANDLMEANAIFQVFGDKVPTSSTKPLTGHCLGASASIEIALCCQMLKNNLQNLLLPHIFDGEYDDELPKIKLVQKGEKTDKLQHIMCNAFGFGGTNAVIIIGK